MTPAPQFASPNDILMDLHGRMVRIETKLDDIAEDNLEKRVSSLETAYRVLAALGTVALFIVTFLQDTIVKTLGI